jgi:hypothetical protein
MQKERLGKEPGLLLATEFEMIMDYAAELQLEQRLLSDLEGRKLVEAVLQAEGRGISLLWLATPAGGVMSKLVEALNESHIDRAVKYSGLALARPDKSRRFVLANALLRYFSMLWMVFGNMPRTAIVVYTASYFVDKIRDALSAGEDGAAEAPACTIFAGQLCAKFASAEEAIQALGERLKKPSGAEGAATGAWSQQSTDKKRQVEKRRRVLAEWVEYETTTTQALRLQFGQRRATKAETQTSPLAAKVDGQMTPAGATGQQGQLAGGGSEEHEAAVSAANPGADAAGTRGRRDTRQSAELRASNPKGLVGLTIEVLGKVGVVQSVVEKRGSSTLHRVEFEGGEVQEIRLRKDKGGGGGKGAKFNILAEVEVTGHDPRL